MAFDPNGIEGVKGIREGRSIPDSLAYEYRVSYFGIDMKSPRLTWALDS